MGSEMVKGLVEKKKGQVMFMGSVMFMGVFRPQEEGKSLARSWARKQKRKCQVKFKGVVKFKG